VLIRTRSEILQNALCIPCIRAGWKAAEEILKQLGCTCKVLESLSVERGGIEETDFVAGILFLGKLADALDASGDAGDQAKTEANLKQFDAVLGQLLAQFK